MFFFMFLFVIIWLTGFGSRGRTVVGSILLTGLCIVFQKKSSPWKQMWLCGIWFLCARGSIVLWEYRTAEVLQQWGWLQEGVRVEGYITDHNKPTTYQGSIRQAGIDIPVLISSYTPLMVGDTFEATLSSVILSEPVFITPRSIALPWLVTWEFSYEQRLYMKQYVAHVTVNSLYSQPWPANTWFSAQKQRVRAQLQHRITDPAAHGVAAGMIVGGRALVDDDVYDLFIRSGLVHLLVVSGGNIMMLVVLLHALLFFVPLYPRLVIIVGAVVGYSIVCGGDSSVLRAMMMGSLTIVGMFAWRKLPVQKLLQTTCILLLLRNPYFLLYDLGFLLSFSAVIGMIRFHTLTTWRCRTLPSWVWQWLTNYVLPCLWASLWVLPVLLVSTWSMNMTGIIINIVVAPFIPFLLWGTVLLVFLPEWVTHHLSWLVSFSIDQLLRTAHRADTHSRWILLTDQTVKWVVSALLISIYYFFSLRCTQSALNTKTGSH